MNGTGERFQYEAWCTRCNGVREHLNGSCLVCASEDQLVKAGGDVVGTHAHKPQVRDHDRAGAGASGTRDLYVRHPRLWGENR